MDTESYSPILSLVNTERKWNDVETQLVPRPQSLGSSPCIATDQLHASKPPKRSDLQLTKKVRGSAAQIRFEIPRWKSVLSCHTNIK